MKARVLAAVLLTLGLVASGCGGGTAKPLPRNAIKGAELGGKEPGDLVSATTLAYVPDSADLPRAARVVYRSTSGDTDEPTVVSGSVFVPRGQAPPAGWPVMALGHASLGIDVPCGPSLSPNLADLGKFVATFTNLGYAVALPDYQGLGEDGVHPYLDARTAGYNLIDAVRALRKTFPDVSTLWGAFGGSQGGGAVWAADEQAASYAPELSLVGAVAISPAADSVGLVDAAVAGTLTTDQRATFQQVVESLARLHPDIDRDDYRSGNAARDWDVLTACSGPTLPRRAAAIRAIGPRDLAPRTPEAAERLREYLRAWALPHKPLTAPLAVAYGGKDTFIPPSWTTRALVRQCEVGGVVARRYYPDKGHGDIDYNDEVGWLLDRFRGVGAVDDCRLVE